MEQRALALDEQHLAPTTHAFEHELLGGARDEVGDDGVDRDPPARDRDPRLARRDELAADPARLRLAVELERDCHLSDRAVGPDHEDRSRAVRQVFAGRHIETGGRLAEIAQLDAALSRECSQLVVFRQELVQAVLDVEAGVDALLEEGTPGRWEAAALRRDADERGGRRVSQRVVDGAGERESFVLRLVALASRARRRRPAARSGSPRARSCRNVGRPNAPPRGRAAYAGETPSPGRSEGS